MNTLGRCSEYFLYFIQFKVFFIKYNNGNNDIMLSNIQYHILCGVI